MKEANIEFMFSKYHQTEMVWLQTYCPRHKPNIVARRHQKLDSKIFSTWTILNYIVAGHERPQKFFQGGGQRWHFAYIFRLLTMQCKRTFTKHFAFS